jgi:hypothetical protein
MVSGAGLREAVWMETHQPIEHGVRNEPRVVEADLSEV